MGNDFFFRMGSLHTVCQDYALSGEHHGRQYALVSDGCSGIPNPAIPGSPFTDFGSRFLIRATCRYLDEIEGSYEGQVRNSFPAVKIVTDAASMARQAMLATTALDATLVGAVSQSDRLIIFRYGDGCTIVKYKDGSIHFNTSKFGLDKNLPDYLRYLLDVQDRRAYLAQAQVQELNFYNKDIDDVWHNLTCTQALGEDPSILNSSLYVQVLDPSEISFVLVGSDGLESFVTKDNKHVPIEDVIDQITAIQSFPGKFITRRCGSFLDKFCAERHWRHTDDFSVAGIYLGSP